MVGSYGDYQVNIETINDYISSGTDKVYGVVVETKEGDSYGLRHMENIWRAYELSWCVGYLESVHNCPTSSKHYAKSNGQTINKITYYTSRGIYVINTEVKLPKISGVRKETRKEDGTVSVSYDKTFTGTVGDSFGLTSGAEIKSSNEKVVTVSKDGVASLVGAGKATVSVTTTGRNTTTTDYTIVAEAKKPAATTAKKPATTTLKKGAKVTDKASKAAYKVTGASTVEYTKPSSKKATSASVPATIKANGKTYKVTSIAAKAFYKNTKLKKVTIGSNIKKIGKQAFFGCKNLKKITIKTKSLKKSTVGSKAFKGINKKATIKVPKKQKKAYKKILKAKGIGSKVKVK